MTSHFVALRVRPANRDVPCAADGTLPECWLLAEWPPHADEATDYWLSTIPPGTPLAELVRLAKIRCGVEHDYRELNASGASGLDEPLVTTRVGRETGYFLGIPREAVDIALFERLVANGGMALSEARHADAAAILSSALALWRGQRLSDVAGQPYALPEISRLKGPYRAALTSRLEADMHRGLHRELISELESLLIRWPDDEDVGCLLVAYLMRSGRTADAARVCRQGINLALDRGPDITRLQTVQRNVLNGERASADRGHRAGAGLHADATALPRARDSSMAVSARRKTDVRCAARQRLCLLSSVRVRKAVRGEACLR